MNIKEYIESGILEAYVLDALPMQERAEVEANIAQYPELAQEVAAIEKAMQLFAEDASVEPPAHLQDQIWNAIQQEAKTGNNGITEQPKIIPFTPSAAQRENSWLRAAIWVALLGSALVNVMLWSQRSALKENQLAIQQSLDSMATRTAKLAEVMTNYQQEKEMMADSSVQTIVMKSMQPGHPMAATIYWNKANGDAYLSMKKLPAPPQGMQYQMWVIQDGKPVSMGVLSNDMTDNNLVAKLSMAVKNGQAFAISLEKEGGNPTPTAVYVLGATS